MPSMGFRLSRNDHCGCHSNVCFSTKRPLLEWALEQAIQSDNHVTGSRPCDGAISLLGRERRKRGRVSIDHSSRQHLWSYGIWTYHICTKNRSPINVNHHAKAHRPGLFSLLLFGGLKQVTTRAWPAVSQILGISAGHRGFGS